MFSVRAQSLEDAGPVGVEISPFHALMARRMCGEGVLKSLPGGRFVIAVRGDDLPALESMRATASGSLTFVEREGVHLAELSAFPDVLDAEMRCTLLHFPDDYRHPGEAEAAPAATLPGPAGDVPAEPRRGGVPDDGMDELMRAIGAALEEAVPAPDAVVAQMARDLPEIERILRGGARDGA